MTCGDRQIVNRASTIFLLDADGAGRLAVSSSLQLTETDTLSKPHRALRETA